MKTRNIGKIAALGLTTALMMVAGIASAAGWHGRSWHRGAVVIPVATLVEPVCEPPLVLAPRIVLATRPVVGEEVVIGGRWYRGRRIIVAP